ncbi:unnamed protein product, partial [Didymodactylos carnosus]
SGSPVLAAFLDFSTAFDKVNHTGLLMKLRSAGLNDSLLKWFESYLEDRRIVTVVDDLSIEYAYCRADNAGCYHSAGTILSLPMISEKTKIKILRIDFSDPQAGKSACDRYAAVIKANVRRYLNEKHNITNAAEFVEAIHSYEGVKGVQSYECSLIRNPKPTKVTFPKITFVNNFGFEHDGIRVHRTWNVGVGKLLKWPLLDTPKAIGHLQCQPCSSTLQLSSIITVPKERKSLSDRSSIATTTTVEPAVQASRRKHRRQIERSSMRDMGMTMYHSKLGNTGVRSISSLQLEETTPADGEDTIRITPDRGWALSFFSRLKSIRGKQTETVVVDEVEEQDDDEFDDNQVVEETEQRHNLRNSMGISNEQSSPPAFSRNRAVSPDKRAGLTTDVRSAKKRSSSRKRTVVK